MTLLEERLAYYDARADEYVVADLFGWRPERTWDACVFGFWLCHVPDDRLAAFFRSVAASARAGGIVCFVDKAATDDAAARPTRALRDGRRFTIVDQPRPPDSLRAACESALLPGAGVGGSPRARTRP